MCRKNKLSPVKTNYHCTDFYELRVTFLRHIEKG